MVATRERTSVSGLHVISNKEACFEVTRLIIIVLLALHWPTTLAAESEPAAQAAPDIETEPEIETEAPPETETKASAPPQDTMGGAGLKDKKLSVIFEQFVPSETISADNAVPFPIDI